MNHFERNLSVFQSCDNTYEESNVVIFSSPMDATCSFRPGTRFAGPAIRQDSIGLEWYSPYFDMDLKDVKTCDIGDLDLPMGDVEKDLDEISRVTKCILDDNKKTMMIGGEHLVTLGTIREYIKKYPDLHIIHFDAHTDLREEFLGRELSHATVLRKCYDLLGDGRIYQFGIRSGDSSEFKWASEGHTHLRKFDLVGLDKCIEALKDKPVYITIDLDVLDPKLFRSLLFANPDGTVVNAPQGEMTFEQLSRLFIDISKKTEIVGLGIAEHLPWDVINLKKFLESISIFK